MGYADMLCTSEVLCDWPAGSPTCSQNHEIGSSKMVFVLLGFTEHPLAVRTEVSGWADAPVLAPTRFSWAECGTLSIGRTSPGPSQPPERSRSDPSHEAREPRCAVTGPRAGLLVGAAGRGS